MRFVVAGGGTGGHIYPALAIAQGLQGRYPGAEILYIGVTGGMEEDIVPKAGLPFKGIVAAGLERKISLKNLKVCWQAWRGLHEAGRVLRKWQPAVVIGTGGYVCGPVVLAAARQGIPTLIHEQNALPGLTNRILARFCRLIAVTFADSIPYFPRGARVRLTGLPVRPEILQGDRQAALKKMGLKEERFTVFSFGGSRGSQTINRAMVAMIKVFQDNPRLQILHAAGRAGYDDFRARCRREGIDLAAVSNVIIMPYIYNVQDALAVADLVISRAGAATLAELTALGRPAILVPYPYAAENHQEYNARALAQQGAAQVILDRELTGELLIKKVTGLLDNPGRLAAMSAACLALGRPRALEDILNCVGELVAGY